MTIKKTIALLLLVVMSTALFSCSNNKSKKEENTSLRIYTAKEISSEGYEGIFVKYGDDAYAPLINNIPGYQSIDTDLADSSRYLWIVDPKGALDKRLPVVSAEHPLIAIYNSDKNMPEMVSFEKYNDIGYTFGTHFFLSESDNVYMSFDGMLSNSQAASAIGSEHDDAQARVLSITGKKKVDNDGEDIEKGNIENNVDMFLGLERNKLYYVRAYSGTKLHTYQLYSDTRAFQGDKITSETAPYKETKKGYFEVKMPVGMESGYYYLSDIGMFKYNAG